MSNLMLIRLCAMFDAELSVVDGMLRNEVLWEKGASREEAFLHAENIYELEQYKELLFKLKEKALAGELC